MTNIKLCGVRTRADIAAVNALRPDFVGFVLDETRRQQEYAVQRVEKCYDSMKQQHMAGIDALNAEWQDFLCGLFPDGKTPDEPEEPDEAETTESAGEPETPESAIDQGALEEKIGAIARELFSIDGEGTET